jgi:hypothetical protein
MTMTSTDIKRVFKGYQDLLMRHRDTLNALNVYPVPDGDTGSNMLATVRRVNTQLESAASMDDVCTAISDGSLRGATGNSGLILSLILRGLADRLRGAGTVGVAELTAGLVHGTAIAYAQVGAPLEGTILTVVREAAEEAESIGQNGIGLNDFLSAVYARSVDALDRTPDMLPVLAQAGVVDAGGAGVVLLLAAFVADQTGEQVSLPDRVLRMSADLDALESAPRPEVANLRYEVMFFLDTSDDDIPEFRRRWAELGDSVVVVGGGGEWNCHIHTDQIGPSIEVGVVFGRPRDIRVTDLAEQSSERHDAHAEMFEPRFEAAAAPVGVVAVVAGDGLVHLFGSLLAQGVVAGGQSMNPSADDLLAVIEQVPAENVIVLPNNKNIVPVAEQLNSLTTKNVLVVPTRSIPQGVAAMMGYATGEESLSEAGQTMSAAASSIISAEVTRAVRRAKVEDLGEIAKGDWMGVVDGTPIVAGPDLWGTVRALVRRIMTAPIELVTIYVGADADPGVTGALASWIEVEYPGTEVSVVDGGQPLYPFLLSFE